MADRIELKIKEYESSKFMCATCDNNITELRAMKFPICAEFARLKQELESLRAKLPKWHLCDEPDEDGFFDLPPESGSYFAQYETTWADGVTTRYCEPLEYDADACDWPQLTNHCRVIRWCEKPEPPED